MEKSSKRQLGRYQLIKQVQRAYPFPIYLADDPKLNRQVEILFFPTQVSSPGLSADPRIQVAQTRSRWRSSGIPRIFDFGFHENQIYIAREPVVSPSLGEISEQLKDETACVPIIEAVSIVRQICLTLAYSHKRGILHSCLNPQDIYFKDTPVEDLPYHPLVYNLGLSSCQQRQIPNIYIAPEIRAGDNANPRADVYSTGVILYELCVGGIDNIADGTQRSDIVKPQISLPPIQRLRPDLPPKLVQILEKAVSPSPSSRFQSVMEFAAALSDSLGSVHLDIALPKGKQKTASILSYLKPEHEKSDELKTLQDDIGANGELEAGDIIHVLYPDQSVKSFPVTSKELRIGRDDDSDLRLDHQGVSRNHALIEFDGEHYTVKDLNSMNGTFLGDRKLEPNKPAIWLPGDNLRIGDFWLRLERSGMAKTTMAVQIEEKTPPPKAALDTEMIFLGPGGKALDQNQVRLSPGAGKIAIFLDPPSLTITPGKSATLNIYLYNRTDNPDTFSVRFRGIPEEWINGPKEVYISGLGQAKASYVISPPRAPSSQSGKHSATILVKSHNDPSQIAEARVQFSITSFSFFSSVLQPTRIVMGNTGQVLIQNQGNTTETFSLQWQNPSGDLDFDPPQARISIPPGQSARAEFRIQPRQTRILGREMHHSFSLSVRAQSGQVQNHQGEFISKGVIPSWAPPAIISLCMILACISAFLYSMLTAPARNTQATSAAQRSASAVILVNTSIAQTATASAYVNSNQATIQAVTATAVWLQADDDQDGLNNNQEVLLGTKPDKADTDDDGINDGEEVNTWNTSPLNPDSDEDGINDGDEIQSGLNPLNKDTDGDGLEDGADPAPRQTSTPTVSITPSPKPPTLTPTPTIPTVDISVSLDNGRAESIPGTSVAYTIQVINHGPSPITNVQVIDNFPGVVTNITWTCTASAGSLCQTSNGAGNINALVNLTVDGTATFLATGTISPTASGLLINSATANVPSGVTETNTVNNLAIDTDTLTPQVSFTFTKTDGKTTVSPGEDIVYTIAVTNNGPSAVSGATVTDSFPNTLQSVTWSCSASAGSNCSTSGLQSGNVNVDLTLQPGGTATITANARVKDSASGTLSNTAYFSSPINPAVNNKTASDTTNIEPKADLILSVSAPDTSPISTPITYTITITNAGPSTASNVVLTNELDLAVIFITSTPGAPTCTTAAGVVTCTLGDIPANNSIVIQIVVQTPMLPGTITNLTSVTATETDPNTTNNSVTHDTEVTL